MKFSSKNLHSYRKITSLLWKYGRSDLAKRISAAAGFGIDDSPPEPDDVAPKPDQPISDGGAASPEQLANDLEAMGPTYIKLGQVLAGRPDLLPARYLKALARLHDNVKPFPYEEVENAILTDLGVRVSKAFSYFEMEPVGSASLGQVHRAALRDGREVVVKVQRPNIRRQIADDFAVLEQIAGFLDAHTELGRRYRFHAMLDEFRLTIQQELNYEMEAHNLVTIGKNLRDFSLIQVPQPIPDYCSRSVLTMEMVQGQKITALGPLARAELDGSELAEELFKAYLQQVLVDGVFHADPHPGNVFITEDGRLALIDLGMVGRTTPGTQENLLKLLLAIGDGNGESVAEIATRMSERLEDFNSAEFRRHITQLVALHRDQGLADLNVGRSLLEVGNIAHQNGLIVPSEMVLLGKTMMQLDEIGQALDPEFDTNASIRRNAASLMTRRFRKNLTEGNIYSSVLELKDFATGLPSRLNRIMDAVANSELELKVKATDAKLVMDGMTKIANRITMGVVLAGLFVGASLLARVTSSFQVFGYPGLAIFCFIAAAIGSFWLVISIFVSDYKSRRKYTRGSK